MNVRRVKGSPVISYGNHEITNYDKYRDIVNLPDDDIRIVCKPPAGPRILFLRKNGKYGVLGRIHKYKTYLDHYYESPTKWVHGLVKKRRAWIAKARRLGNQLIKEADELEKAVDKLERSFDG